MTSAEAITVATDHSSQCLGMSDDIGTLAAGKLADLLILDGDPLQDVGVLQEPDRRMLVMKGGEIMFGALPPASEPLDRPVSSLSEVAG
jgi:imidazolonepropionase-like amidohydrolase